MFNSNSMGPADFAAMTGNDGFGMGNGWWMFIILFALFGGFGRGGFGYGNSDPCCQPATCSGVQNGFDNLAVTNKLNGLENGLCSLGYDQQTQMNGINSNIMQTAFGLQRDIQNMGVANMQDTNALSRQLADCCCENRTGQMQIQNAMQSGFCSVNNAIQQQTQMIMQNDNANYRALHDELVSYRMAQKDDIIAEQRAQIQALNLGISQRNQNDYLVSTLRPCPVPAYPVANPFGCGSCYQQAC